MSCENFSACPHALGRRQLENINLISQFMSNESIELVIKRTGGLAHSPYQSDLGPGPDF